ncbi:hepatocyte growth factor activator-like isoform X3 [Myxocyprinus asiaticus]|uniref:hepatocyte growth factor activator-like isoform X3 n=1 Tax=Myxocyprinus asiaticus TaxID=70543 RepID=UPI00222215B5|nr:hepatocyte growth factor activator-like isoform X3 [Myxocyprinus asiaticus]
MWRTVRTEMPFLDVSVFSPLLTSRVFLLVVLSCLIFYPCMQCARSRAQPPGIELLDSGTSNRVIQKVLTTDGKECKFPFRFGGAIHGQCIPMSSSKAWCSLTHNFDRDQQWGFCSPRTRLFNGFFPPRRDPGLCRQNPCLNGGVCATAAHLHSFECVCPDGFTGALCEKKPEEQCYHDSGVQYRGIANATVSASSCLPWNSDLLFSELTVETVDSASLRGLGEHAFCRNPDHDKLPWCYTMTDRAISWEYCDIPRCFKHQSTRRGPVGPLPSRPSRTPGKTPVCGKKHDKRVSRGRILGGTSALPGAHPWMAALYIGEEFCAGSLVSSCWVLSAAHCFLRNPSVSQIRVVLGQHFFNDTGPNTRTFGVENYVLYDHYTLFQPTVHDIALVKLKKKNGRCAKKTQFIRPICLPGNDTVFPDHSCCKITGWGHMHEKANSYSHLQEGVVKIIPFERCSSPEVYGADVRSGMLCAGSDSCVDACQGDSGGPLACECDGVSFLYGIISWGDGCGRTGKPGVYTLVPKYVDWINSVLKSPKKKTNKNKHIG